MMAEYSSFMTL